MVAKWREWISQKLNPAEPSISLLEPQASPVSIIEYKKAYEEIEIVHRAIEMIINALVEVPIIVEGTGPVKQVSKMLNSKPNVFIDRTRFYRQAFLDFLIEGNTFFYYDSETPGGALWVEPAEYVDIFTDERGFVNHYEFLAASHTGVTGGFGSRKKKQSDIVTFSPDEIIHVKSDSKESIFRGESRLKSLERIFKLYYALISFQQMFFVNNCIPGLVLQTDVVLSDKIKMRLLEHWRTMYSSIFNGARSPAILDGGLKIDKFSAVNFQELDFQESVNSLKEDMSNALGVPYILISSGNNANLKVNEQLFYEHTVLPILEQFCSAFKLFFEANGTILNIYPDKGAILALQEDAKSRALFFSTLTNGGLITPNEGREGLRYPKSTEPDMDKIRVPANIAGSAANPALGGRPTLKEVVLEETISELFEKLNKISDK